MAKKTSFPIEATDSEVKYTTREFIHYIGNLKGFNFSKGMTLSGNNYPFEKLSHSINPNIKFTCFEKSREVFARELVHKPTYITYYRQNIFNYLDKNWYSLDNSYDLLWFDLMRSFCRSFVKEFKTALSSFPNLLKKRSLIALTLTAARENSEEMPEYYQKYYDLPPQRNGFGRCSPIALDKFRRVEIPILIKKWLFQETKGLCKLVGPIIVKPYTSNISPQILYIFEVETIFNNKIS